MSSRSNSRALVSMCALAIAAACARSSVAWAQSLPGATSDPLKYNTVWPAPGPGKLYHLDPTPETVAVGWYDAAGKPVLTMASGDELDVGTLSTCSTRSLLANGVDSTEIEDAVKKIAAARAAGTLKSGPGGHILTGPVYIEGADSGDVLEVRIKQIDLALPYGCNSFSTRSGYLPEDFPPGTSKTKVIRLDKTRMIGKFADGIEIPLHPFYGSIGVAPPASMGKVNSAPPGIYAGNLDNKELVQGTTLYIPIHTKGALFEIGDGHAAQGNGEVDITAIETSLRGRLQLVVRKDMHLTWPRGETPTHYIAMGIDSNLVIATKNAIREAISLLQSVKGMSKEDAYMLVSTACDVNITELVDGTLGVHVMIPKRLFTK
jgi:acetamidase/formamidase